MLLTPNFLRDCCPPKGALKVTFVDNVADEEEPVEVPNYVTDPSVRLPICHCCAWGPRPILLHVAAFLHF